MSDCSICLRSLLRHGKLTGLLCSHVFHVDCIVIWEKNSSACPSCRSPITRHALHLDFSETMQSFENIQRLAEDVLLRHQEPQQQPQPQPQPQPQQQPQQEAEMEYITEQHFNENVRYEMTTARQEIFLARYRDDILNVRLERRVMIATEGEPNIRGYRAFVYFSPAPIQQD